MEIAIPKLLFVSYTIGRQSEVWMWRQIKGLKRFNPHILAWDRINSQEYSLNDIPLEIIPFEPMPDNQRDMSRWIYRLKCLPFLNFFASVGKEHQYIENQILRIQPDIILCHYGQIALRILPIAQKLKIPIVAHFHGLDLSSLLKHHKWYRWSLSLSLKKFNEIIVVGSHQKKLILDKGISEEKVHLIPCGVPTNSFQYIKRQPSNELKFICVSRLFEGKGIEYSIRAFAEVKKQLQNISMYIVGDGPLMGKLKSLSVELNIDEYITFTGMISSEETKQYLKKADIFLQHSINDQSGSSEGFGVSIAEAAATGLPVICTKCGGIPDQVIDGSTGYLVEQRDIYTMADRMLTLARNPELREKMGLAGRECMVANYDTNNQIKKLESVLLSCCKNRKNSFEL